MKKILFLFSVFLFILGLAQENYQFPKIKSSVSLPVNVPISEINSLVNQSVKGVLYEDNSFTDNNNDQFKVKVEKLGNISIKALTNNRLMISVPLKIWAEKGYGTLGVYAYNNTTFNLVMNFITSISANPNWKLDTQTTTAGFVWKEKPVLDYGKVKISIAGLIESTLKEQQAKFTTVIDDQIKNNFNLQPYILQAWNQFSKPINISEEYNTWLKISPQNIQMTPLQIFADKIKTTVGIDLYSETFVGTVPVASAAISTIPNFVVNPNISNIFNLQTTANISFQEATRLARAQFLDKEFEFRDGKSKIKIMAVSVYAKDQKVVVEAQTEGDINGTSFITGEPIYDPINHKIVLTKTDFKLKTKNILYKAVSVLFEGKIKKMIEKDYGIPLLDIENMSKKSLNESFNKEYFKGIKMQGQVLDLKPSQFLINPENITIVIDTKAQLQLLISGMN